MFGELIQEGQSAEPQARDRLDLPHHHDHGEGHEREGSKPISLKFTIVT